MAEIKVTLMTSCYATCDNRALTHSRLLYTKDDNTTYREWGGLVSRHIKQASVSTQEVIIINILGSYIAKECTILAV